MRTKKKQLKFALKTNKILKSAKIKIYHSRPKINYFYKFKKNTAKREKTLSIEKKIEKKIEIAVQITHLLKRGQQ